MGSAEDVGDGLTVVNWTVGLYEQENMRTALAGEACGPRSKSRPSSPVQVGLQWPFKP